MATRTTVVLEKSDEKNQSPRMYATTPNYRTRRVEAIKQKVRRHQQASERQRIAERAAPAYLQHHGRISTCTPETFLRKRKPVAATASILSGDLGFAFHNPSSDTESNTQSAPTETRCRTPEHIATEPRTPIKVPDRSETFDDNYDLTPRYMRRYLTPEALASKGSDPRFVGLDEKKTTLSQGVSKSIVNFANPYSAFPAPIEPPAYVAGPLSPSEEKIRGLFRRDKAAPRLPRQSVVPTVVKTTPRPHHGATAQKWSSAPFSVQSSAVVPSPAIMQTLSIAEWKPAENGRDEILTASPTVLEQGAMDMGAFLDTVLCIFALGLVVIAGAGTMWTLIVLITAPASW